MRVLAGDPIEAAFYFAPAYGMEVPHGQLNARKAEALRR